MKTNNVILVFISLISLLIVSCTDEDDILGHDLIDSNIYDITQVTFPNEDFNTIPVYTIREDSVSARGNYSLLGRLNDPYFGESEASFCMQILLPSNNIELNPAENTEFTLELSLPYYGGYGDTLSNMELFVYELTENLGSTDTTSEIYSNQSFFDNLASPLLSQAWALELNDSVDWDGEIVSPRLILDLSTSGLGEKILFNSTATDLSSNESFVDFFKGLYLQVSHYMSYNSVAYFNTVSSDCFLRLSYTNNNNEPQIIEFPVGTSSNRCWIRGA